MQHRSIYQPIAFSLCLTTFSLLLLPFLGRAQTATPIAFGESLTKTLLTTSSTLTFSTPYVQPGDILFIRIKPNSIQVKYELYAPSGQSIKTIPGGFNTLIEDMYPIPVNGNAGVYTILISNTGIWVGEFCILLERMNAPPTAVFLGCGASLTSDLTCPSSIKSFRYLVQENTRSRITISSGPAPGAIAPEVWVCTPTGTVLSHGASEYNVPLVLDTIPAPDTGCYYVLVADDTGIWDSDFSITHTILTGTCAAAIVQPNSVTGIICEGGTLTLTASSPLPGASYAWIGPNGFTSTQQQITFANATPAQSGIYTVTVSAPNVCSSTASKIIVVHALPTATASVLPANAMVCAGESFMLTVVTNAANPAYAWSGPNGYLSTLKSPTIATTDNSPTELRPYIVTVTDGTTGCTSTSSIAVQVNAKPTAIISSPAIGAVCTSSTLFLDVTTDAQNPNFQWSGPNGFISTLKNPSIPNASNLNAGTYRVTVTDNNDCTKTASKTIAVNSLPTANVSVTPGSGKVCMDQSFTLSATTNAANPAFQWSGPNGFTSTLQMVTLAATSLLQSGDYTVVVTNGNTGCTQNGVKSMIVETLPVTSVTVISPSADVCFGENVTLCSNSSALNPTYIWSGPNGFSSNSQCISFVNPNQSGLYLARSKDGITGCISGPDSQQVNIYARPNVNIVASSPNGVVCAEDIIILCASSSASSPSIYWTGPDGFVSDSLCIALSLPGPTHDAFFKVRIVDMHGCADSAETTVHLKEVELAASSNGGNVTATATGGTPPYIYTLSPGGQTNSTGVFPNLQPGVYTVSATDQNSCSDSKQGLQVVVSTVEPAIEWGLYIGPNPSSGLFEIRLKNAPENVLQCGVFNGSGLLLRTFALETTEETLDLTDLPAGLYSLRISDGENIGAMRIVITK